MSTPWKFDSEVSKSFNKIAETHIPDYQRVNELTLNLLKDSIPKDGLIVELGCSNGNFISLLNSSGFTKILGIDQSSDMINEAMKRNLNAELVISSNIPENLGPVSAIVSNWTIQFNEDKISILKQIFDSLTENGIFILTEKMTQSALTKKQYYDWKHSNGVSWDEIQQKEDSLKGVMFSESLEWWLKTLREIGFTKINIANSYMDFTTMILIKDV